MDALELPSSDEPCRLCLKKCDQSYSMYVNSADGLLRDLPKKILECIALEISDAEPQLFSKLVCSECICKLDYFHEFRENCRKCQAFFDEMMMFCHTEAVVEQQQQQMHHLHVQEDVHQQMLPDISFSGSDFLLDGSPSKEYEYIIQSLEKEDISFSANVEALKLKQELEISIEQNQQEQVQQQQQQQHQQQHHQHQEQHHHQHHGKFAAMAAESSSVDAVIPSEETCFNNLAAIVESIAAQQKADAVTLGYVIEEIEPKDNDDEDLDYDDFVGIETVDDNRDASISEIQVQEIIEEHKFSSPMELVPHPLLTDEIPPPVPEPPVPVTQEEVPLVALQPPNDRTCDICAKVCTTRTKLKIHRNSHFNITPFKCPMADCPKAFKSKIGLDEHVAKHTGNYPIACDVCGKGFMNQSYLTSHLRTHTQEKTFRCNICKQATFKTKKSLIDHKNRHLGLKPFECGQCEKQFTNQYLLQQHQQVAHGGVRFPCPECDKSFTCKSYLKVHSRIHRNERPFVCVVCQRGHLTQRDLDVHMTLHTGKKEFICDVCGKEFARLNAMQFHRKIHENRAAKAAEQQQQQVLPGS